MLFAYNTGVDSEESIIIVRKLEPIVTANMWDTINMMKK